MSTLAALREEVFGLLAEDPAAPVYWTATEIDRHINDAYLQAARDTGALETSESVEVVANQSEFSVAGSKIKWPPLRVTFDGRRLANVTKWELDRTDPNWQNLSGYVTHYVTTQQGYHTFRLYKRPDSSTGIYYFDSELGTVIDATNAVFSAELGVVIAFSDDGTAATFTSEFGVVLDADSGSAGLVLYGKKIPDLLTSDTDVPELPLWTHTGLALAAAARALVKYGEQRDEGLAALYNAMAKQYAQELNGIVAGRAPERNYAMSAGVQRVPRRQRPEDQTIVP